MNKFVFIRSFWSGIKHAPKIFEECCLVYLNPLQKRISHLYCAMFNYSPLVDGFLAFYHFGICCVYVVFIAESIKQIVDEYLVVLDVRLHMCFILIPLFLLYSIRTLKTLAPFSTFANLLLLVGEWGHKTLAYICM